MRHIFRKFRAGPLPRILAGAAALLVLAWLVLRFSPYPELRKFMARPYSVRYYDRNGILAQITPVAEGLRREKSEIPAHVKAAFVFTEARAYS